MPGHAANYSKNTIATGFNEHKFVERDGSSWDISNSGLTEDDNFHDLDLTPYGVPVDATLVLMDWYIANTSANKQFRVRGNGRSNGMTGAISQVANVYQYVNVICPVVNGVIEYQFKDANFTYYMRVSGWWI